MQSLSIKYRLHIDLNINMLLCLHIFYKIVDSGVPRPEIVGGGWGVKPLV